MDLTAYPKDMIEVATRELLQQGAPQWWIDGFNAEVVDGRYVMPGYYHHPSLYGEEISVWMRKLAALQSLEWLACFVAVGKAFVQAIETDAPEKHALELEFQRLDILWRTKPLREAEEAKQRALSKGREKASKNKAEKASEYHAKWREWAGETINKNPLWDLEQLAEYVLSVATRQGHKMANGNKYQQSTIKSVIKGVRKLMKKKACDAVSSKKPTD